MYELIDILTNVEALFLMFVGVGGMLAHFVKLRVRGQMNRGLWSYLFVDHRMYTIFALGTYFISAITLLSNMDTYSGFQNLVLFATTGYTVDSSVNQRLDAESEAETIHRETIEKADNFSNPDQ